MQDNLVNELHGSFHLNNVNLVSNIHFFNASVPGNKQNL